MSNIEYEIIEKRFKSISEIPKDEDIYYKCLDCMEIIPSVPVSNIGCKCGNIFIDKDYWRLIVADLLKFVALRRLDV